MSTATATAAATAPTITVTGLSTFAGEHFVIEVCEVEGGSYSLDIEFTARIAADRLRTILGSPAMAIGWLIGHGAGIDPDYPGVFEVGVWEADNLPDEF